MEKIWLKNYPSDIPYEIPAINKNLVQMFLESCDQFQNKTSFISFGKKISYSELKHLSFQLASYLQSQGLKKGDKIAIQLPNLLPYPVSLWASILSGLTVVNLNPLYTASEMLMRLRDSDAKAIILLSNCTKKLESIYPKLNLKSVIVIDPGDLLSFPKKQIFNFAFKYIQKKSKPYKIPNSITFLKALKQSDKKCDIIERDLNDIAFIQYTGGTTGESKGACLTQKNVISNLKQSEAWLSSALTKGGDDVALAPLPLYHVFSFLVNGLLFFMYGVTNVLIADPRKIDTVVKNLKKHPVTLGTGVDTLFKALINHKKFRSLKFKNWKFFVAGGMALESHTDKMWKEITRSPVIEGYGLTEASPVVCCNLITNPKQGSIGLPFPSTSIRIVDEKGEMLPINQDGELEIKGPQVMKGYYKNEAETKRVLSDDGWLKTGDVACINEEGFVFIKDRKKDMINVSGLKVYPNEVENTLTQHENVKEAAVVGIPDEHSSEAVKAFVVTSGKVSEDELRIYCKKHLAAYKVPKKIEFIDSIPKTNIGKNLRRVLK